MRVCETIKAFMFHIFEIGRKYRVEQAVTYVTKIGTNPLARSFYIPFGFVFDGFTGVPDLMLQMCEKDKGILVSYRRLFGLGPRVFRRMAVGAAVHDWIWASATCKKKLERGGGAKDDQDRWVTFEDSNLILEEALKRDGFGLMDDIYGFGLEHLALSAAMWNSHNDGRPRAC